MVKASMTDDDAKALEAERKKAAAIVLDSLLGPAAISKADVLYAATERAWQRFESKIAAEAQAKNVALP
jgi:hypothetical protein